MIVLLCFKAQDTYAENEVVMRFKTALENLHEQVLILDQYHHDYFTQQVFSIAAQQIKFAISLHLTIAPLPQVTNYLCVWDPFVWRNNYHDLNCLLQYDDYLIIDTVAIQQPLKKILNYFISDVDISFNSLPPTINKNLSITPEIIPQRKLFYCGIGRDHANFDQSRLRNLLKLLDHSGLLNIYGPEQVKLSNHIVVQPWKDYQSYRGAIAFDGTSLINTMHASGISLVVSTQAHRQTGIPSARIFEACASGNVIIADENAYFDRWRESIYRINFDQDDAAIYQQILICIDEINKDPQRALTMAQQAQTIFKERYSLEAYFTTLINNHLSRKIFQDRFALAKKQQSIKKIIFNYCKFSDAKGFYAKARYLTDKFNIPGLHRLNQWRLWVKYKVKKLLYKY